MRRALAASLAGLLAAASALAACADDDTTSEPGAGGGTRQVELAGDEIGSAVLPGLGEGAGQIDLASFRGRPVVVNFWASTCPPCVREMPALEEVHQAADGIVAFVGVAVNDRVEDALALAEQTGVTYQLAADPRGELFVAAAATVLPTTLVLDAGGDVVRRLTGEITATELVEVLRDDTSVSVALP